MQNKTNHDKQKRISHDSTYNHSFTFPKKQEVQIVVIKKHCDSVKAAEEQESKDLSSDPEFLSLPHKQRSPPLVENSPPFSLESPIKELSFYNYLKQHTKAQKDQQQNRQKIPTKSFLSSFSERFRNCHYLDQASKAEKHDHKKTISPFSSTKAKA